MTLQYRKYGRVQEWKSFYEAACIVACWLKFLATDSANHSPTVFAGLSIVRIDPTGEVNQYSLLLLGTLENDILSSLVEIRNGVSRRRLAHVFGANSVEVRLKTIIRPGHLRSNISLELGR